MPLKRKEIYLFHYTTAKGLIGIIGKDTGDSKKIWATNIFYLNDWEEFTAGIKMAQSYLGQLRDKTSNKTKEQCLDQLINEIEHIGPDQSLSMYVGSFSRDGDELSQWRAYCPKGGYSIGFPISRLRALAKKQGFVLKRCVYDKRQQIKIIKQSVDEALQKGPSKHQILLAGPDAESLIRCTLSSQLIWKLTEVCPILKNPAFKSEKEYRLISKPHAGNSFGNIQFRNQKGAVVPYVDFSLDDEILSRKIRVNVGPTPHPRESLASVYSLLRWRTGYAHDIKNSSIPYRYW
jgi:hypothetical protein